MILSIVLIMVLIAVFFIYKYSNEVRTTVEDTEEEITENSPVQEQEELPIMENPQIEIQPQPGLNICADQCGDGICKPADTACGNSLNCPCDEDKTSCPQDCQ